MAVHLTESHLTILTNSFLLAQELLASSENDILLPGGKIYRDRNVIVSPFENDVIQNHYASKMFIGATAISPLGLLENDPLPVSAEIKLMKQADELIVLVRQLEVPEPAGWVGRLSVVAREDLDHRPRCARPDSLNAAQSGHQSGLGRC